VIQRYKKILIYKQLAIKKIKYLGLGWYFYASRDERKTGKNKKKQIKSLKYF